MKMLIVSVILLSFFLVVVVENVYSRGLMEEFTGSTNTAIHT